MKIAVIGKGKSLPLMNADRRGLKIWTSGHRVIGTSENKKIIANGRDIGILSANC